MAILNVTASTSIPLGFQSKIQTQLFLASTTSLGQDTPIACGAEYKSLFEPDALNNLDKLKLGVTSRIYDYYRLASLPEKSGQSGVKLQARKALNKAVNQLISRLLALLECKLTGVQIAAVNKAIDKLRGLKRPVKVPGQILVQIPIQVPGQVSETRTSQQSHYPKYLPKPVNSPNTGDMVNRALILIGGALVLVGGTVFEALGSKY